VDPKDPVRRKFQTADKVVKVLSGLLGIVFLGWIIYLTFFQK
jgi:hypothetical protein